MNKNICLYIIGCLLLISCNSKQKANKDSGSAIASESVDEVALQRFLGLETPIERLGYAEKKFNTCNVGYGYSKVNNCRDCYFVVIQFQMLCRNSEGTVSEVVQSSDLIKNANRSLRWDLKNFKGSTATDEKGYSQIRMIAPQSQRQQRLKLTLEKDFLYLRAGEVNKIVTPLPWCQ